jgi:hypothetical protein
MRTAIEFLLGGAWLLALAAAQYMAVDDLAIVYSCVALVALVPRKRCRKVGVDWRALSRVLILAVLVWLVHMMGPAFLVAFALAAVYLLTGAVLLVRALFCGARPVDAGPDLPPLVE